SNNLFKQLTTNVAYAFSKTTDNVSEIFNTFGGGTTVALAQNPLDASKGEHALSGLDIPHQFTVSFVEQVPFMKAQRGVLGHIAGGWSLSGSYIWNSGQTYTPFALFSYFSDPGDFYDAAFLSADNSGGVGVARPFLGNPSAPVNTVGI